MDTVSALVIGDPHFKAKNLKEGKEFIKRCTAKAQKYNPTFIVCLGDTLDKHEVGRSQPYNLALEFIRELSSIAPFYLIIGNHDLINNQQFLTDAHFFNAVKAWPNVFVVDYPIIAEYQDNTFVFCPYVPPGRFGEALDELTKAGEAWELSDCIFAHQEFMGCKMGAIESIDGDIWDPDYPPVISGHIHDEQEVSPNIYYPGSSVQHSFGESPNKKIWHVVFDQIEDPPYFEISKINLGMKGKKMVYTTIDEIETFDFNLCNKYDIKLGIKGSSEQFKVFRRGNFYTRLIKSGVKISYTAIKTDRKELERRTRDEVSYYGMLKELVKEKSDEVKNVYTELVEERAVIINDNSEIEQPDNSEPEQVSEIEQPDNSEPEQVSEMEQVSETEHSSLEGFTIYCDSAAESQDGLEESETEEFST